MTGAQQVGTRIGGKGLIFRQLINLMPPHEMYIEPFLGGGSVLLHKKTARISLGVDLDEEVIEMWSKHLNIPARTAIFGGTAPPQKTMVLPSGLHLLRGDALEVLKALSITDKTLIYADPPYLMETRRAERSYYRHEMGTYQQHRELLTLLKDLDCMIMISHYANSLYERMLADWHLETITTYDRANNKRTECVWMNYDAPTALHDYSFLGSDYRERERIKKKKNRWIAKLRNMPRLERQALLAAIEEAGF